MFVQLLQYVHHDVVVVVLLCLHVAVLGLHVLLALGVWGLLVCALQWVHHYTVPN